MLHILHWQKTASAMTLQFTVLELSCLLHIRLQLAKKNWFVLRWKKTYSILHVLFSNSSLFKNEVFGEGDFIKNVCVRITLLVFPLFHTFFPYKFLNVFLRRVAWMPITKQSLSIQAKGVWSGTSPISRQL